MFEAVKARHKNDNNRRKKFTANFGANQNFYVSDLPTFIKNTASVLFFKFLLKYFR